MSDNKRNMNGRALPLAAAAALAFSGFITSAAYAVTPSVGDGSSSTQTGSGSTEVTVQLVNGDQEVGGTEDPNNADNDGDGLGDNIAFTVPTKINFVSDSQGVLTGPSSESTYIENESMFSIHASSLKVDEVGDWKIVADAKATDTTNAIDFQVGPESDMQDASAHLTKADVSKPNQWNMSSKKDSGNADRVELSTTGDINNVDENIADQSSVAIIHWYVKPGTVS